MRVLAALLHLGTIKFAYATDEFDRDVGCIVLESTAHHMQLAANLLEIQVSVLDQYFRIRTLHLKCQSISLTVSVNQATRCRDAFCSNMYESLENEIVCRMNASLRSKLERCVPVVELYFDMSTKDGSIQQYH
ncbi:Aste57867_16465 [Aphanomyces stellatus]|uniref:Aste57867_16465 protein n=1 Tax=Aphanomyces stellatus TaxID=120398 RepID=A0A485L5I7_9STRA|nr:hypothetical protein As57867_016408 [Aphanomyces stellatus]VFT93239.1 Aste57867_16465 [Aphanomyces stellatus]